MRPAVVARPGMAEGEFGRAIETLHERAHAGAILIVEAVDARAVNRLRRRSQPRRGSARDADPLRGDGGCPSPRSGAEARLVSSV